MIFDLQLLARARQRLGVRRQVERGAALERQTNTQSGVTATAVQDLAEFWTQWIKTIFPSRMRWNLIE